MKDEVVAVIAVALLSIHVHAGSLEERFQSPPDSAKPYTWYHWMDGNVSKDGITKDIRAMKESGSEVSRMFNIGGYAPDGPVDYMSDRWREMVEAHGEGSGQAWLGSHHSQLRRLVEQRWAMD